MKVGIQIVFQNHEGVADADMFRKEIQLAVEAEAMGYDFVGLVEHHFADYAMCPDNAQALAFIAAKTKTLKLMPAAFILPWNDPLRVVEKAVLLDILSEGRVILGLGRGLSRREYIGFRTEMAESRERFDQAAEIVLNGLETGFVEGDTDFYKQPRVEIRPRGERSFKGRSYMVGMSPSSVETAARLGLGCLKFSQGPWDKALPEVNAYRDRFREIHAREAPPLLISDIVSCFEDEAKANEYAWRYMGAYHQSVLAHYEMTGNHFKDLPSYANYAAGAEILKRDGVEKALKDYIDANLAGTPSQIVENLQHRAEVVGDTDLSLNFSYGSMDYEDVWQQAKLFADKVMPHLDR
jgi:alkanesulfonate monooxygenase SsuD/methylene tetrahydromethanopterin reductase-like flavin-dependent oxidoreductase (luciferase family)